MTAKTAREIARRINEQEISFPNVQSARVVLGATAGLPDYTVVLFAADRRCVASFWTAEQYTDWANR